MYTQTCLLWRESKILSYNGWLGYIIFYYNHWSTLNFKVKKVQFLFKWVQRKNTQSVNLLVWNKCTNVLSFQLQMLDLLLLTQLFYFQLTIKKASTWCFMYFMTVATISIDILSMIIWLPALFIWNLFQNSF